MFEAIATSLPEEWEILFQLLTFPIAWIPAFQSNLIQLVWNGAGMGPGLSRVFLLLPALLLVVAIWTTMLAVYTVPFRSQRGQFLTALALLYWEVGRSIWLFWVGFLRFLWTLVGWIWGLFRLTVELLFKAMKHAFESPFVMMDWMGRKYFKPGVPWIAFILTLGWSALEALIFTFTLAPTVRDVFWNMAGFEPGAILGPILFIFLFAVITGSFASLQVLAESMEQRKIKQIIQMVIAEVAVMFFEVLFLYRELIDAITPWLAAQTGGELRMGLVPTLAMAGFAWVGIRAVTWFLFARYGTPAILAVLARETLTVDSGPESHRVPAQTDWWRGPIDALKREHEWFRARSRELLELLSLPVLQLLAAAVNCATVVIAARPAFELPFTKLEQVMATETLLKALGGKRPMPIESGSGS